MTSKEELRALRIRAGWSQQQLGVLLRVHHTQISRWERGTRRIDDGVMFQWESVCRARIAELTTPTVVWSIPPMPDYLRVVIDRFGLVWRRDTDDRYPLWRAPGMKPQRWGPLLDLRGPVRIP